MISVAFDDVCSCLVAAYRWSRTAACDLSPTVHLRKIASEVGLVRGLAVVLYLLLDWSGVMASLPSLTSWLFAAGGVLYSMGVIFHLWRSLRFQNAIWHVFVLLAAVCHYTAVLEYAALARA